MSSGLTFAALLLLVGGPIALLLITLGLVLVLRRRGRGKPVCGACGYAVAGLETLKCPECGSDLREVGITGGSPRRTGAAT
jgi:hypothetical protein